MKTSTAHYQIIIDYSKADGGYVARVPALPHCSAYGDIYEEAAREVQDAIAGWVATAKEAGLSVPAPGPNVEDIQAAANLLNLASVARESNIPEQTLFTKLRRGTPLRQKEAIGIARALNNAGLALVSKARPA